MSKAAAERKAAKHARQAAAGGKKLELTLHSQELEMLAQQLKELAHQQWGKCKEQILVQ